MHRVVEFRSNTQSFLQLTFFFLTDNQISRHFWSSPQQNLLCFILLLKLPIPSFSTPIIVTRVIHHMALIPPNPLTLTPPLVNKTLTQLSSLHLSFFLLLLSATSMAIIPINSSNLDLSISMPGSSPSRPPFGTLFDYYNIIVWISNFISFLCIWLGMIKFWFACWLNGKWVAVQCENSTWIGCRRWETARRSGRRKKKKATLMTVSQGKSFVYQKISLGFLKKALGSIIH